MIESYLKSLREFVTKGDSIAIAAAFLIALAVYSFLQTLMDGLVAPAIAALFDEPDIYLLHFTLGGNDFLYGNVLVGSILLALVFVAVAVVARARQSEASRSTET
jgi:large-conductance mechanosensitive channel